MEIRATKVYTKAATSGSATAVRANATASARIPTVTGSTGYTPDPTKIVMLGDYSTNNFNQWPVVQNVTWNSSGSGYVQPWPYCAAIVDDATYGKACRFEVRDGDIPFSNTERSEVQGGNSSGGGLGQTRWYEFANKFDTTFPNIASGFGVVNQWHGQSAVGSPPLGWYIDRQSGSWTLVLNRQEPAGTFLSSDNVLHLPLNKGAWQHITMRIVWSDSDATGSLQVWHNQVRQTFTNGTQTYMGRTLITTGGNDATYYKEGLYRSAANTVTGIIYHTGFRCCTEKTGLTWAVP